MGINGTEFDQDETGLDRIGTQQDRDKHIGCQLDGIQPRWNSIRWVSTGWNSTGRGINSMGVNQREFDRVGNR